MIHGRVFPRLTLTILCGVVALGGAAPGRASSRNPTTRGNCSSIVLDNGGFPVFGANLDHVNVNAGLVFVNKRGVRKTGVIPGTTGRYAQWQSRHASITFNLVGFEFPWAGMNEHGLTISTMYLGSEILPPDERPPLDSGEWIQYMLDTCETVDEVIATDDIVRIITVDHYLLVDGTGEAAVIEFIDGEMVVHTGAELHVRVLTNSEYDHSVTTWFQYRNSGNYSWLDGSLQRFCLAADRVSEFTPTNNPEAVTTAFEILHRIRGELFSQHSSQWSIVFDTEMLRVFFKTLDHQELRYVDLSDFELRCGAPVQMLDIQAPLSGDVFDAFLDFSFEINYDHHAQFLTNWGIAYSPWELRRMLAFLASYPCVMTHRPGRRLLPASP